MMKISNLFKKIGLWFVLTFQSIMFKISLSLKNVEEEVLKIESDDLSIKNKQEQKVRHKNLLAQKLQDGQRDEQFVKDFYEVLEKADKFLKNATPSQMEVTAEKWGMEYGKKDRWGRRYEHYGFFDPKSKHYGKTLGQVLASEVEERKTKDDDYPVEFMFSNKPIESGFAYTDIVEVKFTKTNETDKISGIEKIIPRKFPLQIVREVDTINKIEELTEYVHVKKISEEYKLIEFFIPAKFKLFEHPEDGEIFKEIINISQVWMRDEWRKPYGYRINKFEKKTVVTDKNDVEIYHVVKMSAFKIENLI